MIGIILLILAISFSLAWLWAGGIDYMRKNHPYYKGEDFLNWTEDEKAWNHVVDYICTTENLKFVHLIGGEPLLNPKFENLIDHLLEAKKTDIYLEIGRASCRERV